MDVITPSTTNCQERVAGTVRTPNFCKWFSLLLWIFKMIDVPQTAVQGLIITRVTQQVHIRLVYILPRELAVALLVRTTDLFKESSEEAP